MRSGRSSLRTSLSPLRSYKPFHCNTISYLPFRWLIQYSLPPLRLAHGSLEREDELEGGKVKARVKGGMQCLARSISPFFHMRNRTEVSRLVPRFLRPRLHLAMLEDPELGDFLDYMEKLKNHERLGVPRGAGTDTDDGFDLGRMRQLLQLIEL